jgi:hypothetical protein
MIFPYEIMEQVGNKSNHTNDSLFISDTCTCILLYYYCVTDINLETSKVFSLCKLKRNCKQLVMDDICSILSLSKTTKFTLTVFAAQSLLTLSFLLWSC